MAKTQIQINDFDLFHEAVKTTSKIVESAKFTVSEAGMEVYGARARTARCEITTNAITSKDAVSFSIENLQSFLKLLSTVKDVHGDDFSGLRFFVDLPFVRFESKKFKTKFSTCNEDIISKWVTTKISAPMKTTSSTRIAGSDAATEMIDSNFSTVEKGTIFSSMKSISVKELDVGWFAFPSTIMNAIVEDTKKLGGDDSYQIDIGV